MSIAIISGSAGLVGSEAANFFANLGLEIVGIDNDMRRNFFGDEASTDWRRLQLERDLGRKYRHVGADVRDSETIMDLFRSAGPDVGLVLHCAAQPSHDWAARDPATDFSVNAVGTLNMLEATRQFAPDAVFIFTSTNKVYGDNPNHLPLIELDTRWEIEPGHTYENGIREDMPIDQTLHSIFGASKLAGDILTQEYGRYFGIRTTSFRGGCLTGPSHAAAELHGFLVYLMKCAVSGRHYTVYGYKGKQVRDNIHSADLIRAFYEVFKSPRIGEVYNIGGGRFSNCSILEAIQMCQEISGQELRWTYSSRNRVGDHIWWIGDNSKFMQHFPEWRPQLGLRETLNDIYEACARPRNAVAAR